ncbi:hypothetical protein [Rhodomicrobium lacus]|uniref:hypothetical protein n=1 Tax=Rhodomicrobium lacus TaxID=2498452 RepID=UPI000F8D3192|nr:hypothetical protein [Rhodomicrobium lacus]
MGFFGSRAPALKLELTITDQNRHWRRDQRAELARLLREFAAYTEHNGVIPAQQALNIADPETGHSVAQVVRVAR